MDIFQIWLLVLTQVRIEFIITDPKIHKSQIVHRLFLTII